VEVEKEEALLRILTPSACGIITEEEEEAEEEEEEEEEKREEDIGDAHEKAADIGKWRKRWTEKGEEEEKATGAEEEKEGGREGGGYKEGRWCGTAIPRAFMSTKRQKGQGRMPVT